jgi:hypothetical protein
MGLAFFSDEGILYTKRPSVSLSGVLVLMIFQDKEVVKPFYSFITQSRKALCIEIFSNLLNIFLYLCARFLSVSYGCIF